LGILGIAGFILGGVLGLSFLEKYLHRIRERFNL